ncbi:MAG: hypothetical protein KDD42_01035 [Bdellovibrionales bacterium]|nr:hypothetical protein [Bdellovibrionales bacterium]
MQERVCIVLNERESHKAKVAEALVARLKEYNITASRIGVDENLPEILLQRKPDVLVLDYLLGDFTTGLDVLSTLTEKSKSKPPLFYFLTDEPSVRVAVDAMKLGALEYYELENPQSIGRLTRDIDNALKKQRAKSTLPKKSIIRLDEMPASSEASARMIKEAKSHALAQTEALIIYGPQGSGRLTLAQAIHHERREPGALSLIDLHFFDIEQAQTYNSINLSDIAAGQSLVVLNLDQDDGTFLDWIYQKRAILWPTSQKNNPFRLIGTCHEQETLRSWQKLLKAAVLKVPELDQRREDLPVLTQHFVREAAELSGIKIKGFDSEVISWISKQDWPGNIRQLKAATIHAAIESTFPHADTQLALETHRELWNSDYQDDQDTTAPDSLTAALTVEASSHNYRIAAARLGCSIKTLREVLR